MVHRIAIILFLWAGIATAQQLSDPLNPVRKPYPRQVGIIGGAGIIMQSGNFNVSCDCPAFEGGRGSGFMGGLVYEDDLFENFVWGAAALYENRPFEALYRQTEPTRFTSAEPKDTVDAPGEFRHRANAKFSFFTVMPFIKYVQFHPLFIRAGIGASTVISSHILHEQELLTSSFLTSQGVRADAEMTSPTVVEDGDFKEAKPLQLSLNPAIGVDIRFGKSQWYLAPVLQYSLPLTTLSDRGESFRLHSWQVMAELRYTF